MSNFKENETPKIKQCKVCHKEIANHLKFCPNCGAKYTLIGTGATVKTCKKCGGEVASNLKQCPHCRAKTPVGQLIGVGVGILIILVVFIFVFAIFGGNSSKDDPKINNASVTNDTKNDISKDSSKDEEKILFENENYKVTYIDFEDKNLGITMLYLNLKVENNSDNGISVTFEDAYMNDTSIQFISGFPLEIAPGKNAIASNGFGYDGKGIDGIDDVKKLEFKLVFRNSSDFSEILKTDNIVLEY